MNTVEVFDPALCCSSGVCGPSPDTELAAFASTLESLKKHDVNVARHNLAQEPLDFAQNAEVKAILEKDTDSALPLVFVNGNLYFRGVYPSSEQLAKVLGIDLAKETCCSDDDSCCQPKEEKAPISFVKVEDPKSSCCDPSSGCC
ncbi:Arsenical resistance operon trans-acting repressor ArsD superfamily [Verrucomicrobiia bacterium DG1235]|nr:Arsenical resistance operon trans-acting repressor ArsD superfamily [Verrucomicrobiae bacterium DG1235]